LCEDNFKRLGGVNGVVLLPVQILARTRLTSDIEWPISYSWRASRCALRTRSLRNGPSTRNRHRIWCH
jgi:hypothetical protein